MGDDDLILKSKLLSGGMEDRYLSLFNTKALEKIEILNELSRDDKMATLVKQVSQSAVATDEDQILLAAIEPSKNEWVDKLVQVLQHCLFTKRPMVPHARVGGDQGMQLARAAFAVIVKFSDLTLDLVTIIDEVEIMWEEKEGNAQEILIHLKTELPAMDKLIKRWESASKMRAWLS